MFHLDWRVNSGSISIMVITLALSIYGLFFNNIFIEDCMLHPYSIARRKKYYTTITSGFVHANVGHLVFNMLTYYFFCFILERIYLGTFKFILLYMLGLILCDIPTIIKNRNNPSYYSLGASGAISAILFCWIVFNPTSHIGFLFLPFEIPAWIFGPLYLIYCTVAGSQQWGNINHDAHFYGAVVGIIMAFVLNYTEAHYIFYRILGY